jgi:hypothetical protein
MEHISERNDLGLTQEGPGLPSPPIQIVVGRTDADIAADLLAKAMPHLKALCAIIDEGSASGLEIQFSFGRNQFGKSVINGPMFVKPITPKER